MRKPVFLHCFILFLLLNISASAQDYKVASDSSGMPSFLPPEAGVRGFEPVSDREVFNPHLFYSLSKQSRDEFKSIRATRKLYKKINDSVRHICRWFRAACIVTKRNSIGAAEGFNFWVLNKSTCRFMIQGNAYLSVFNKNVAAQLLRDGKVNRIFVTAYFADSSRKEIAIYEKQDKELDKALVLFEQTLVQYYIDIYRQQHPGINMNKIFRSMNRAMRLPLAPRAIKEVLKKNFSRKKRFHFQSFDDRVTLGFGLIDRLYNATK